MYTPEGITHWGKMFRFFLFGLVESISEIFFSLFSGKSWREGATPRGGPLTLFTRGQQSTQGAESNFIDEKKYTSRII